MHGTVASTDSTRRRRRRSATARTRSAACASATARPTPTRSTDWQALRDELDAQDRGTNDLARARSTTAPVDRAADAAEAGADDFRRRALRSDVETLTIDLGERQSELAKLELAERSLERTWLFLERGDATLHHRGRSAGVRGRRPDAHRRGPGGGALPPRPGGPRRARPGARQLDLPGRVHRAGHRVGPAPRPDGAALPARAAAAGAGRRPGLHQPAPPADARPSRPGRGDRRHGRAHARADRAGDHDRPGRIGRRAERRPADGRPSRGPGSTAECPQARGGDQGHRGDA